MLNTKIIKKCLSMVYPGLQDKNSNLIKFPIFETDKIKSTYKISKSEYRKDKFFLNTHYPLLLSRVIDRLNESDPWKTDIFYVDSFGWGFSYKDFYYRDIYYHTADEAREMAIVYIFTQYEKKVNNNGK